MNSKGNEHRMNPNRTRGFTLIELLVVVAIIALLISILLPALGRAKRSAKDAVCQSNERQLVLAGSYYAQDNADRLLWVRGTKVGSEPLGSHAPFYQYDQLFGFWKYLKDLDIYRCPSAAGTTSVKEYDSSVNSNEPYFGFYVVKKADDLYTKIAYKNGWWPDVDPLNYKGKILDPLFTEYWFADFGPGASIPGGGPIPQISGGQLSQIPLPQFTVILCDGTAQQEMPGERGHLITRHGTGKNNFAFLDGHVEARTQQNYLDLEAYDDTSITPRDYDAFGNRPFWFWGLTRTGFDAAPTH